MTGFDCDTYPGRPKILFVGWPNSPHTHRWVDLLRDAPFNVRVFCLNSGEPPAEWWPRCWLTTGVCRGDPRRRTVFPQDGVSTVEEALAGAALEWRPDIVHTLGIWPAAFNYRQARLAHPELASIRWIVQARGGPDTALLPHDEHYRGLIAGVLDLCDHFIADNPIAYETAIGLGLARHKAEAPGLGPVPGSGGLDLDELRARGALPPSRRERLIVWPKAYSGPSGQAIQVLEAIRLAWPDIAPCRFEILRLEDPHLQLWYRRLFPPQMREHCAARLWLPHDETLALFARARVMLAPSLLDGIPNVMLEGMALGAVPIVSPLETIVPVVRDEENVLFARNLNPEEIAAALVRAMTDDALADRIAENNFPRVRDLADRGRIRPRVLEYYETVGRLARGPAGQEPAPVEADRQEAELQDASSLISLFLARPPTPGSAVRAALAAAHRRSAVRDAIGSPESHEFWIYANAYGIFEDAALRDALPPVPPISLIRRFTGTLTEQYFVHSGASDFSAIERLLNRHGHSLYRIASVLDFGCGAARVGRLFALGEGVQRYLGCDLHRETIAYLDRTMGFGRFFESAPEPPLPLPPNSLDLVFSVSVMTHLDEISMLAWLAEFHRLLKPGGLLVQTTHGRVAMHRAAASPAAAASLFGIREEDFPGLERAFRAAGFGWVRHAFPVYFGTDYGIAVHSEQYIAKRWTDRFDLIDIIYGGIDDWQDLVLLQKPEPPRARQSAALPAWPDPQLPQPDRVSLTISEPLRVGSAATLCAECRGGVDLHYRFCLDRPLTGREFLTPWQRSAQASFTPLAPGAANFSVLAGSGPGQHIAPRASPPLAAIILTAPAAFRDELNEIRRLCGAAGCVSWTSEQFRDDVVEFLIENRHRGAGVIEVGTWKGGMTAELAAVCRRLGWPLWSIDSEPGCVDATADLLQRLGLRDAVSLYRGTLAGFAEENRLAQKPVLAIIDGSHRYDAVVEDIRSLYRLPVLPHAAAFHDYSLRHPTTNERVSDAVRDRFGADVAIRPVGFRIHANGPHPTRDCPAADGHWWEAPGLEGAIVELPTMPVFVKNSSSASAADESLTGVQRAGLSDQRGESDKEWWESAHRENDFDYVSGYSGHDIWRRLEVEDRIVAGAVVLNIGVGQGLCTRDLAARGCIVHALDITPAALARVEDVIAGGWLAENLGALPSRTFDLAISHLVTQHLRDADLLAQMRAVLRALKPSGIFAMQFIGPAPKGLPEGLQEHAKTGGVVRSPETIARFAEEAGGVVVRSAPKEGTEYWQWHMAQIRKID